MNTAAQIVEMDHERDRKTCLMLERKVTGANRELAQWLLDHPRYSAPVVAGWIGCSDTRIKRLRRWAEGGFVGAPSNDEKRKQREGRHHGADAPLESLDDSESDDDLDADIAAPEVLIDNIMHAIGGINENARIFNKFLKVSALDREAATRIIAAIDKMMGKWRSIQSTLERKGYRESGSGLHGDIHVRPIAGQQLPQSLRVRFPKALRHAHEIGTRFLVYAKLTDKDGGNEFVHTNHAWDVEVLGKPD
jgi:hypothetical protein